MVCEPDQDDIACQEQRKACPGYRVLMHDEVRENRQGLAFKSLPILFRPRIHRFTRFAAGSGLQNLVASEDWGRSPAVAQREIAAGVHLGYPCVVVRRYRVVAASSRVVAGSLAGR